MDYKGINIDDFKKLINVMSINTCCIQPTLVYTKNELELLKKYVSIEVIDGNYYFGQYKICITGDI